jgi:hypothetical protein
VDESLVDLDALRIEWARPLSDPSTTPLLQAAWLALDAAPSAAETPELVADAR